ncbi:hypothetical protein BJ170DRAFT_10558 [Xylariales sp. AK1849]|nr:hypothetical protein BJ170DRAFT_10558 [Xylariales sp. AK1849]
MDPCASSRVAHRSHQSHRRRHRHSHGVARFAEGPCNDSSTKHRHGRYDHDQAFRGKSTRPSNVPSRYNLVESWLEQTGALDHAYEVGFIDDADLLAVHHRRSRLGVDKAAQPERRTHSSATWQPQHLLSRAPAHTPHLVSTRGSYRRDSRKRPNSDDSSFLSVVNHHRVHSADHSSSPWHAYAYDETSLHDLPGKIAESDREALSQRPAAPESPCFDKRPRHKTRTDKYDPRGKERRSPEKSEANAQRHRSKRSRKDRKPLLSSKNVMGNFNSNAVLNDRITVSQNLRPGIFQNGRKAATKPIPDLAFSEMHFLQDRKRNTKPKLLSKSRLRELEKQNKEIEEVSSFFLPPKVSRNHEALMTVQQGGRQLRGFRTSQNLEPLLAPVTGLSASSTFGQGRKNKEIDSFGPYEQANQNSEPGQRRPSEAEQKSSQVSKATTYITWSRSQTVSPFPPKNQPSPSSPRQVSRGSTTPNSIRMALIETGIYRGTGISGYDDTSNQSLHDRRSYVSATDVKNNHAFRLSSPEVEHRNGIVTVDDQELALQERWQEIMPSDWRIKGNEKEPSIGTPKQVRQAAIRPNVHPHAGSCSHNGQDDPSVPKTDPTNRQRIAEGARLIIRSKNESSRPVKNNPQHDAPQSHHHQSEQSLERISDTQISTSDDWASLTSRDAMPPPSVPIDRMISQPAITLIQSDRTPGGQRRLPSSEELSAAHLLATQYNTEHQTASDGCVISRNPFAPSQDTRVGSSGTFSSIQCASWIRQTQTPPTPAPTRSANASRNSMSGPLYTSQIVDVPERIKNSTSQAQSAQQGENIAEFIARIEREARSQSPEAIAEDTDLTDEKLDPSVPFYTHCNEQFDGPRPSHESIQDYETKQLYVTCLNDGEWDYYQDTRKKTEGDNAYQWNKASVPRALHQINHEVEGIEEEKSEMSTFWRPNQFTQF